MFLSKYLCSNCISILFAQSGLGWGGEDSLQGLFSVSQGSCVVWGKHGQANVSVGPADLHLSLAGLEGLAASQRF